MFRKPSIGRPSHPTVVAYIALSFAMSGTAYAAATIGSGDVIDESLKSVDLKNGAAVKSEDVVNDTVLGGGLVGRDIKESTLAKVPDADKLDGKDSTAFMPSTARFVDRGWLAESADQMGFDARDVPAGETQLYAFGVRNLAIHYQCPANPATTNGIATIDIDGYAGNLFIDNGGENPDYVRVPDQLGWQRNVPTAASGEALTIQFQDGHGRYTSDPDDDWLSTIIFFSVHRPGLQGVNAGYCHVQGQIMDGAG